nr:MAG TPA: hypothetical protein [Caudoviricetes sp.]
MEACNTACGDKAAPRYRSCAALSSVAPVLWWLGGGAARLAGSRKRSRSSNPFESPPFGWKRRRWL